MDSRKAEDVLVGLTVADDLELWTCRRLKLNRTLSRLHIGFLFSSVRSCAPAGRP